MRAPEIAYLFRSAIDTAQNTLEVINVRVEVATPALTNTFLNTIYTVPNDHVLILSSAWVRSLSQVVAPTPGSQIYRDAIFVTPPNTSSGVGINNVILTAKQTFIDGTLGEVESNLDWSGEMWARPGSQIRHRSTATNADTTNVSGSICGFLIPKGNVSFA